MSSKGKRWTEVAQAQAECRKLDDPLGEYTVEAELVNLLEAKASEVERAIEQRDEAFEAHERFAVRATKAEAEVERLRSDYEGACKTIAEMHAAAVGEVTGPKRGVVEDVADLRAEAERLTDRLRVKNEALRRIMDSPRMDAWGIADLALHFDEDTS